MMTRRQFVSTTAAAALAVPAFGWAGTTTAARPAEADGPTVDPTLARLLGVAALAPSSHNEQPWAVGVSGPRDLAVAIPPERRLPEVDPDGRELVLSVGCFLENLVQAAGTEGLEAEPNTGEAGGDEPVLVRVRLLPAPVRPGALERLRRRRTLRSGHLPRPLAASDAVVLVEAAGPGTPSSRRSRPGRGPSRRRRSRRCASSPGAIPRSASCLAGSASATRMWPGTATG